MAQNKIILILFSIAFLLIVFTIYKINPDLLSSKVSTFNPSPQSFLVKTQLPLQSLNNLEMIEDGKKVEFQRIESEEGLWHFYKNGRVYFHPQGQNFTWALRLGTQLTKVKILDSIYVLSQSGSHLLSYLIVLDKKDATLKYISPFFKEFLDDFYLLPQSSEIAVWGDGKVFTINPLQNQVKLKFSQGVSILDINHFKDFFYLLDESGLLKKLNQNWQTVQSIWLGNSKLRFNKIEDNGILVISESEKQPVFIPFKKLGFL